SSEPGQLFDSSNSRCSFSDAAQDDAGKKQLEKTDITMKAESEMGYDPSLLVLMERETDMETMHVSHVATRLKDRSDVPVWQTADNESPFEYFLRWRPVI